jgi:hypothetical protein
MQLHHAVSGRLAKSHMRWGGAAVASCCLRQVDARHTPAPPWWLRSCTAVGWRETVPPPTQPCPVGCRSLSAIRLHSPMMALNLVTGKVGWQAWQQTAPGDMLGQWAPPPAAAAGPSIPCPFSLLQTLPAAVPQPAGSCRAPTSRRLPCPSQQAAAVLLPRCSPDQPMCPCAAARRWTGLQCNTCRARWAPCSCAACRSTLQCCAMMHT